MSETPTIREQLRAARDLVRLERARLELTTLNAQRFRTHRELQESYDGYTGAGWGALVDPMDAYRDADIQRGAFPIVDRGYARKDGDWKPFLWTDFDLDRIRSIARWLTVKNKLAIGAMKTIRNFTVKTGFKYDAKPLENLGGGDKPIAEQLAAQINAFLKEFDCVNSWPQREQAVVWKSRRDGDAYHRHFPQPDGMTWVRPVEPEQVYQPLGSPPEWKWGHLNADGDVERILAYAVAYHGPDEWEEVSACDDEMIHLKLNVDSCVKRGLSDFYCCGSDFNDTVKLLGNMAQTGGVQAAIAWIEQFDNANAATVAAQIAASRNQLPNGGQTQNPFTGQTVNNQKYESGSIPKVGAGKTYLPAPQAVGASVHIQIVQAMLRSLGVRWSSMPEYMISGDSSNANYASTLVSGSPFVTDIECEQVLVYKPFFLRTKWVAVRNAARAGRFVVNGRVFRFDEIKRLIDIHATPPTVAIANKAEEAEVDHKDMEAGVLSIDTRREKIGLDGAKEDANIKRHPMPKPQGPEGGEGLASLGGRPSALGESRLSGTLTERLTQLRERYGEGVTGEIVEGAARLLEPKAGGVEIAKDSDPDTFASLAADILYGIYGEKALAHLHGDSDTVKESLILEAWDASHHPRDAHGRFIPKGSAEAKAAAAGAIDKALKGEGEAGDVMSHLGLLTVAQLNGLHKIHGIKAPGRLKAQLVESIKGQLEKKGKSDAAKPTEPEAPASNAGGGKADAGTSPEDGGPVAGAGERPAVEKPAEPANPGTHKAVPAEVHTVNKRLDRFEQHFRAKGMHQVADWMGQLREHINTVGTDAALEALGPEVKGKGEVVQYGGHNLEGKHDAQFIRDYLDRVGINLIEGGAPEGSRRAISTVSASSDADGVHSRGDARDVFPTLQTLRDKLDETQHLPGLEKSEDLSKLMGGEFGAKVPHFTPDVVKKLDETYGEGKWIVKSYGDEAYAGYGIFFPQRVKQLHEDAKRTLWDAGGELAKHGFSHLRDDKGDVVGIKHSGGDEYKFGTPKYNDTINGSVREWGDKSAVAASNEKATALPEGKFMASPAFPVVGISNEERAQGITFKKGQEGRVHIHTRDGKAEIVPHSTWLKQEHLPVVFENEDTKAMAQAAVDAINALPESERKGQLYAPDIVKTADGYKVVEANPANEAGASGYLADNPFVIDSYVSHVTGREPAHVQFIRKLLTSKKGAGSVK